VPLLVAWLALAGMMMCALRSRVMDMVEDWEKEGLRILASVWKALKGSWSVSCSSSTAMADSGAGEWGSVGVETAEECMELDSLVSTPSCSLRCWRAISAASLRLMALAFFWTVLNANFWRGAKDCRAVCSFSLSDLMALE